MSYIIHAPSPYTGCSGGIRALYKLADELRHRECEVAVASLGASPWAASECPYEITPAFQWGATQRADAVHVYPEIVQGNPSHADRVVRWLLGPRRYETGDLEFTWAMHIDADVPRLMVDIIEREWFYPKDTPGSGVVWWRGKGFGSVDVGREITFDWPATRKELGDVLRGAELLISLDPFSAINSEAAICGTPVQFPNAVPDAIGAETPFEDLDISGDVDRFIEIIELHFGG